MFVDWRSGELQAGARGAGHGIIAGTMVATAMGWRPVEALTVGDEIMTFDGGLQKIVGLSRGRLWRGESDCPRTMWPIRVPKGLLGNRRDLELMPEETVVIESDTAEHIFDDPFALIPALALADMPGVERVHPDAGKEVVSISFSDDQVIYVEGSALIFCAKGVAGEPIGMAAILSEEFDRQLGEYRVLSMEDARLLACCVLGEYAAKDRIRALRRGSSLQAA